MSIINFALRNVSKIIGAGNFTGALETVLDSYEKNRLAEEALFWDYYNGRFYTGPSEAGELPYINLVRGKVIKSANWLVGEPPEYRFRDDVHDLMSELAKEILENSGLDYHFNTAEMGGVSGNVILQTYFDADLSNEGGMAIRVLESDKVFLEYRNKNNTKTLSRVMLMYEELDDLGNLIINIEIWDPEYILIFSKNQSILPRGFAPNLVVPMQFSALDLNLEESSSGYASAAFKNPYGELPFVHIRNLPTSNSIYGRSDIQDDWILNEEANEQLLSYKDNVDFHSNPLTLVYGASSKDLEKGAGKVWGNLPADARVENLEVTQTFEMITTYMDLLTKYSGLGSVPFYVHSLDKEMTTDGTQAQMRLAFLPMVEYTNMKRVTYGEGFKQIMQKALKYLNIIKGFGLEALDGVDPAFEKKLETFAQKLPKVVLDKLRENKKHPFYECEVIFKEHLPRNRALELADITTEMNAGLEDETGGLKRLGVTNVEDRLLSITKSKLRKAKIDRLAAMIADPEVDLNTLDIEKMADLQSLEGGEESDTGEEDDTEEEPVTQVEERTGQSAERTQAQRSFKGKGDM